MSFLTQMLQISVIHNFATVKPKTLKLCKMIHLSALVYVISLIYLKTWPNKKLPDGHIRIRCISHINAPYDNDYDHYVASGNQVLEHSFVIVN